VGDVSSIGTYSFANCNALIGITLGGGVRSIGVGAFRSCPADMSIQYCGSVADWANISIEGENEVVSSAEKTYEYIIADPWDGRCCQWEFAAKDGSEAIVIDVLSRQIIHPGTRFVRLRGLNPDAMYRETGTGRVFSGAFLMNAGITLKPDGRDYIAQLLHFKAV
jgi:hypothetical protein